MRRLILASASGPALTASAWAGTYLNTIDDSAALFDNGKVVAIGGPIGCPAGLLIKVHLLVSQHGVAIGDGTFAGKCTGKEGRWFAVTQTWAKPAKLGPAQAHAWATTWNAEGVARSWVWGKDIKLKR